MSNPQTTKMDIEEKHAAQACSKQESQPEPTNWYDRHFKFAKQAETQPCCPKCGEMFSEELSPNIEAFEISGSVVCDDCAEEIFEENSQFGVGA